MTNDTNNSILWVLNGCGLEGKGITGGPVRFYEISKRFANKGIVQHLLTTPGGEQMQRTLGCELSMSVAPAALFLKNEPCRPFRFWSYLVTSLLWRLRAKELTAAKTIITVSDYFCDIIPALRLKKKNNAKWIAWIHHCETHPKFRPGNRLVNELTYRMQKWSFRKIARYADAAWINDTLAGDEIEARLIALGMPKARIRRMWNGIDYKAITQAKASLENKVDAIMIGVRPNKGLHDIIPIWEKVIAMRPGTSLMLIGGMSGEANVVKEITKRGLPISVFKPECGFLTAYKYHAKIKEAKILFAPSHEEGWGIAVCEAMAAGLPVVAYDLPAYQKIYPGAYMGIPCFDKELFAQKIVEFLNNDELYNHYRNLGDATSAKYDWGAIAQSDFEALP